MRALLFVLLLAGLVHGWDFRRGNLSQRAGKRLWVARNTGSHRGRFASKGVAIMYGTEPVGEEHDMYVAPVAPNSLFVKTATASCNLGKFGRRVSPTKWELFVNASRESAAEVPCVLYLHAERVVHKREEPMPWYNLARSQSMASVQLGAGTNTTVFVADTSFDLGVCTLYHAGQVPPTGLWTAPTPPSTHRKVRALWRQSGTTTSVLAGSHGTATASMAAGTACTDVPAPPVGVADAATLVLLTMLPIGVTTENGVGLVVPADLTALLRRAAGLGATVASFSWGATESVYDSMCEELDDYCNEDPTMVIVVACGNDGPGSRCGVPSICKCCVAVGATMHAPDTAAWFSSSGQLADGRKAPTVYAAGYDVEIMYGLPFFSPNHLTSIHSSGTSFSAPAVAGWAAHFQTSFRNRTGRWPTRDLVRAAMLAFATPVVRTKTANGGEVNAGDMGYGLVRWETDGFFLEGVGPYTVHLRSNVSETLRVAVSWTDSPAIAGSLQPLVHNVDLFAVVGGRVVVTAVDRSNPQQVDSLTVVEGEETRLLVKAPDGVRWALAVSSSAFDVTWQQPCFISADLGNGQFELCAPGQYRGSSSVCSPPLLSATNASSDCACVTGVSYMQLSDATLAVCVDGSFPQLEVTVAAAVVGGVSKYALAICVLCISYLM